MANVFIKDKAIRQFVKDYNKQIKKEALRAIDMKVGEFILSCVKQWNGSAKRIDATVINLVKM